MKRLTMIFPDNADLDFAALVPLAAQATEFKVETIEESSGPKAKIHHAPRKARQVGQTAADVVKRHFFAGGRFSRGKAQGWLTTEGYSPTTVSPVLSKLRAEGTIVRLGADQWEWTHAKPNTSIPPEE